MTIQLPIWVVYHSPPDFPGHYVAQLWDGVANKATPSYLIAPTLDAVRLMLPPELVCLARQDDDDSTIVETWL